MNLVVRRTAAAIAVASGLAVVGLKVRDAPLSTLGSAPAPVGYRSSTVPPTAAPFIKRLVEGRPVVIVTMGTSLTFGRNKWVPQMERWLRKSFPGKATVINEALPFSASEHRVAARSGIRAVERVVAHDPDVVFIEFAFNDAYRPFGVSLEESKENLNFIIDRIFAQNPDAEIILQTMNCAYDIPGHVGEKPASKRRALGAYYEVYREVARDRGLLLIDHYPNWLALLERDPEKFLRLVPDGIHPRTIGSREVILPQLKRSLLGAEVAGAS